MVLVYTFLKFMQIYDQSTSKKEKEKKTNFQLITN